MDSNIMLQISQETERAIKKHGHDGVLKKSWSRASNILSEEAGEVSKAVLETYDDGDVLKLGVNEKIGLQRIYDEAKETASVAVRIMDRCRIRAVQITTCKKCGRPKEESRANSNLCRKCDHGGENVVA